jgi:hypothetical protein
MSNNNFTTEQLQEEIDALTERVLSVLQSKKLGTSKLVLLQCFMEVCNQLKSKEDVINSMKALASFANNIINNYDQIYILPTNHSNGTDNNDNRLNINKGNN